MPDLSARFTAALRHGRESGGTVMPSTMARAAATALRLDSAGIALSDRLLRLPIGASSPDAVLAEQLQATLGEGPCIQASRTKSFLTADESSLGALWPIYHLELTERTPFRAVAAVPLSDPSGVVFAALNLYSVQPVLPELPSASEIDRAIAGPITALLMGLIDGLETDDGSDLTSQALGASSDAHNFQRRVDVWAAVGMVMEAGPVSDIEALARLRAYSFRRGFTIDDVGSSLVERQITPYDVLFDPPES